MLRLFAGAYLETPITPYDRKLKKNCYCELSQGCKDV